MVVGQREAPFGGHIVIIALFSLVIGLSGLMAVPPLDRDESRYIQATTQMIESGDYVTISFQDDERNKKPAGIYWLQAMSVQVLADVEDRPLWAYRLPSLISAVLATIFTYLAGCALFGTRAAMLGSLLLAAAPVVAGEASIAKTDAALLASICGMQAALAWLLTEPKGKTRWRIVIGFWVALSVGILIKGPIALMVGGLTIATIILGAQGRFARAKDLFGRLKPLVGLPILLVLVLPWFIAIGIVTEGRFYAEAVGKDMLGKVTEGQESHGGPFGYHLLAVWAMFWPASLFLLAAGRHIVPRWREGAVLFCLGWVVPNWLVFEISSTKLPHYTMVLYPGLALLIGYFLMTASETAYRKLRITGAVLYAIVGVAATIGVTSLANLYSKSGLVVWHYVGAGIVCLVTLLAAYLVLRKRSREAVSAAAAASLLFAWGAFDGILPNLDDLLLTPRLSRMLDRNEAHPLTDDKGPVALVGYHEPSAVFTLGTNTQLLDAEEAAAWIAQEPGRVAVIEARKEDRFLVALPAGVEVEAVETITGFNYSNNKDMQLTLYRHR